MGHMPLPWTKTPSNRASPCLARALKPACQGRPSLPWKGHNNKSAAFRRMLARYGKTVGVLAIIAQAMGACQPPKTNRFEKVSPTHSGVHFANMLEESPELNYFTYPYLYMGGGVAVGDLDNDGLADLFFTGNMVPNKLYRNKGGWFLKRLPPPLGLQAQAHGIPAWPWWISTPMAGSTYTFR